MIETIVHIGLLLFMGLVAYLLMFFRYKKAVAESRAHLESARSDLRAFLNHTGLHNMPKIDAGEKNFLLESSTLPIEKSVKVNLEQNQRKLRTARNRNNASEAWVVSKKKA